MTKLAHVILCQLVAAIWIAAIWVLYCTPACTHPIEHLIAAPVAAMRARSVSSSQMQCAYMLRAPSCPKPS